MRNPKSTILVILIFIGCLWTGFWIARHKPLWNDEFYSQVASIHNTSYSDQFLGHIPEGANAPLFYALQKLFLQLIRYQAPSGWPQGHWTNDGASQILLRINPVVFMSLSMAMVFYYFAGEYSLTAGFCSLFFYLSSYTLWVYWAEARPYALLVFLTTLQSVVFLKLMGQKEPAKTRGLWLALAGTNILLSLAFILSLGQILAVSLLGWMFKERDWKKYIGVTLLPAVIILFYYMQAPKYHFFFGLSPDQLIRDNIPRERFQILFIFLIFLSAYFLGQKNPAFKYTPGKEILKPVLYVSFMMLALAATGAVLMCFALHAVSPGQGFLITSRYFIYLTPIGVIATTMLLVSIIKALSPHRLLQWATIGLIGLMIAPRFLKVVPRAVHSIMGG